MILRLAAAGAPLAVGLPAHAQTLAGSSAYRAAENDRPLRPPGVPESPTDTWIRKLVSVGDIVTCVAATSPATTTGGTTGGGTVQSLLFPQSTTAVCGPGQTPAPVNGKTGVYELPPAGVGTPTYWTSGGQQVPFDPLGEQFSKTGDAYVLVLFVPGGSLPVQGYWPQYQPGDDFQGLHCSSWTSATGQATPPDGTTCVGA